MIIILAEYNNAIAFCFSPPGKWKYIFSMKHHLPPKEECHDNEDNSKAAENDAHQNSQIVIIVRLTQ